MREELLEFLGAPLLVEPFDNLHHREHRDGVTTERCKVRAGFPDNLWVNALEYLGKDRAIRRSIVWRQRAYPLVARAAGKQPTAQPELPPRADPSRRFPFCGV